MPTQTLTVREYVGSVLDLSSLANDSTILLSNYGSSTTAPLKDNDGTLSIDDNGISTFDGNTVTYVGQGTFTPGLQVGGVLVPTGSAVEIVIFNAGGTSYFYFPDGEPNILGALAAVIDIDDTPAEIFPNPYVGTGVADVFRGDDLDNEMFGGGGDDKLFGNEGDDILNGGGGNDRLKGDEGNDTIFGGAGDDTIEGGAGADEIDGGLGTDLVVYLRSGAGVTVDLEAGGGLGGDAAGDTLTSIENVKGSAFADVISGNALSNELDGNLGNDVLDGRGGDDLLYGRAGADTLFGGDGEDTLAGGAGDDELYGGANDDVLLGGLGNDLLDGGIGDDRLRGGKDQDTLTGGAGNDFLLGEAGDDLLLGGEGDDRLEGGNGDDTLDGGPGNDRLTGGRGNDTFIFRQGSERAMITDFEDNIDTLVVDEVLWGGGLTAQDVIDTFGKEFSDRSILEFDGGERIVLPGLTDLQTMVNDLEFL